MTDKYEHLVLAALTKGDTQQWGTPAPGTFTESTYRASLPNNDVLIHRLELDDRDRILGFAVTHMTAHEDDDHPVVEVDSRHGEVHLHQYRPGNVRIGRHVIRIIQSQRDVELGYEQAMDVLEEKWEEHRRRWQRGR